MAEGQVRIWRPGREDRVLLMGGTTTRYAIEPRGEYVFGVVAGHAMKSRRGRQRRLVRPGQLVAWDPSNAHSGDAVDGRPWTSRLMIVEGADLAALATDEDGGPLTGVAFPEPVVTDPRLARGFLRLHSTLSKSSTRLERDAHLAGWLRAVISVCSANRPSKMPLSPRDDRALRLACDHLGDRSDSNVGLDELAAVAGIGKFRLVRLFRERTGLPPHALQIAHRVRRARRLLESGHTIAETAASTGFADQSHLHRHFQRSLGFTPGEYQRRFRHPP
jgi:AraC-like DNA-binding protein